MDKIENKAQTEIQSITDVSLIEPQPSAPTRNYGIDFLRIISMFMIVGLHTLGHGKIIEASAPGTSNYYAAWFMRIMFFCAVNCYGLISGYVGVKSKFKFTNIIILWLQVVFYSVLITLGFAIFMPGSVTTEIIIRSFLPLTSSVKVYWYFGYYTVLYFFTPALNAAVNTMSKKRMGAIIGVLLFLTSFIYPLFRTGWFGSAPSDIFDIGNGYSVLWLAILYLSGAWISKHSVFKSIPKLAYLLIYLACVVLTFSGYVFGIKGFSAFVQYNSPTIILCGIALLLLFSKLNIGILTPVIKFLSPLTFGVYLIHEHTFIRKNLISGKFAFVAEQPTILMILYTLCIMLSIYLICSAIEYLRALLFKVLKVKKGLLTLENKIFKD